MKTVFVSNMLNHHSYFLSAALKELSDSFVFVATNSEFVQGYQRPEDADFVLHYDYENQKQQVIDAIIDADVVIFGACPDELIDLRMKDNKLSFLYSERFFKKGAWRRFIPTTRKKLNNRVIKHKNKNLFVLCASAYLPYDLSLLGFPATKCYKWGYFPKVRQYDDINKLISSKLPTSILWVARLIDWKHPEVPLMVAKKLKSDGYDFTLNMLGSGILEEDLKSKIKEYGLESCVNLCGSKQQDEVRTYMERSEIFMFTSDHNEGWGAVLNESMNSACAVVASDAIGSVPYLLQDQGCGSTYKNGDIDDCYRKVKYLIDNPEKRQEYGINAYRLMTEFWNAQVAAERLLNLSKALIDGEKFTDYKTGPCSKAEIVKDN